MMIRQNSKKVSAQECQSEAKWSVVVDDLLFPMPRRVLTREQLLQQIGKSADHVLVRDRNSQNDELIGPESSVDLAEGNVFRLLAPCTEVESSCDAPAKLAFVLDDAFEVTVVPNQSLDSLRGLFELDSETEVVRDFESPQDESIGESTPVFFRDGPVFTVRASSAFIIIVNGRRREVVEHTLSFAELIALAYESPPQGEFICWTITYRRGPRQNPEGSLEEGRSVHLAKGMIFNVQWTDKS